jgi:SagB-type dehydrogenase family enzyme
MTHGQSSDDAGWRSSHRLAWSFHWSSAGTSTAGEGRASTAPRPGREDPLAEWTPLPASLRLELSLSGAVARRVSCRSLVPGIVDLATLATLLRIGYGASEPYADLWGRYIARPVPSAGALYTLELSVIARTIDELRPGIHHYVPLAGGLELVSDERVPGSVLSDTFHSQPLTSAAAVFVVSTRPKRALTRHGDRGYRYLLLEAGHVAQNLNLVAAALDLGSLNLGGFDDMRLARILRFDEEEIPLYAVAFGWAPVPMNTSSMTSF